MDRSRQDALYEEAAREHRDVLRRLARGYETDKDRQRDLLQDIHLELWRSLTGFDGRCSLKTWVYRVAHNVGASHAFRRRRRNEELVGIEDLGAREPRSGSGSAVVLLDLVRRLKALDRQVFLLYLEGASAAEIADVTGLTASNVATKVHRIRKLLRRQWNEGELNGEPGNG